MTWLVASYLVIDWFCTNVEIEEIYTRSVIKTIKVEELIIEVVIVYKVDMVTWVDRDNINREIILSKLDILLVL